jgi:hypothetical protein
MSFLSIPCSFYINKLSGARTKSGYNTGLKGGNFMSRPVGVTLIGVLDFLGMAFWGAIGLFCLVGMSFLGAFITKIAAQSEQQLPPGTNLTAIMASVGVVMAIMFFVVALIAALIGWGMLKLKNWARICSIIWSSVGVLLFALAILGSMLHFQPLSFIWNAGWFAVNGVIIWYLLQPQVRAAFAGRSQAMAATA